MQKWTKKGYKCYKERISETVFSFFEKQPTVDRIELELSKTKIGMYAAGGYL